MNNFSQGLTNAINKVKELVTPVAQEYSGTVDFEFPAYNAKTPVTKMLFSIGIDKVESEISSFGNYAAGDYANGDTLDVRFAVVYHCPIVHEGYTMVNAFMKVADKFHECNTINCIKIECDAITYDRSKRTTVLKSYFTIRVII
ncbi:MAG: hypothetical protein UHN02_05150 [Acutalibacteraceae bacterium]|nr:hypothetical protein [Acutalibacteraceae bacterium]